MGGDRKEMRNGRGKQSGKAVLILTGDENMH